jgi:hypothetical protein
MKETTIEILGSAPSGIGAIEGRLSGLGFSSVSMRDGRLVVEKTESSDLKGRSGQSCRMTFSPDRILLTFTTDAWGTKKALDAYSVLVKTLAACGELYAPDQKSLGAFAETAVDGARSLLAQDSFTYAQEITDLKAAYESLECKYRDVVQSNEQNARILIDSQKKNADYLARVRALEGMSDSYLAGEVFRWLKAHGGEINMPAFSKAYGITHARVEEVLDDLLKKGYIAKK